MKLQYGYLNDYFESIAYKRIKPVEIDPTVSNEHEFNGVNQFKEILGEKKKIFECNLLYVADAKEDNREDLIKLTWYDARENHPKRSEYRLYYTASICFDKARPEDLLILCRHKDGSFTMLIARHGDTIENQLLWLFGIVESKEIETGRVRADLSGLPLGYVATRILENIGIEVQLESENLIDVIIEKFPSGFPTTDEFSTFARGFVTDDEKKDPDGVLIQWLEWEESLFRALERNRVQKKLKEGFRDVDDFIRYSLSVQNRRKSRAGHALENHLRFLFSSMGLKFTHNKVTGEKTRPDFIFPGIQQYNNNNFNPTLLTVLGVKTTCKDRWRQVLAEASRVKDKHLFTLQPGISQSQTNEMKKNSLQLVVPKKIMETYSPGQQDWLWNLEGFTDFVKDRQQKANL